MKVVGIIPARFESTRFPGKPLAKIKGKSMIQRVYEQCKKSKQLSDVVVATDDERIYNHIKSFSGKVVMTNKHHLTGTERCNEAAQSMNIDADIIINIQGDEPFINPNQINELVDLFENENTEIGTLVKKINSNKLLNNPNNPKAIFDKNRNAINFCRNIESPKKNTVYYKHIGIYGFRKSILTKLCALKETKNEKRERLEQLRWLDNNYKIKVGITSYESQSIDTPQDIEKI
ncbi:MAG: 3-deoxy-manno-octulosonate cytidylyltransferase [Flavobacteriales bacterium]|nr:3-deoxy-manno-octulosonate cytidylyltransferase [Flavobacteriales bacterium]|tara:strand:+ start:247191 stop:247889 length:699 start_codon:yes stop_codon:yes gene_type:complete